MSYFSDVDIRKALNKDIVIEPFLPDCLTPIGYDFRVGDFVFSLEKGLLDLVDKYYELPPKSTIQILTMELLWVSPRVGGTFHSKVSLVSKGLSHISTTLDPQWYGRLLITLRNNTDTPIRIKIGETFVTLIFARVRTPTRSPHNKPPLREDILLNQLNQQTDNYIKKITSLLNNKTAEASFEKKVRDANQPMVTKVVSSVRSMDREERLHLVLKGALVSAIMFLAVLNFLWNFIKPLFNGIAYDSKVFAVQVTAIIALISLLVTISKKPS
ncbi:hypothetical protein C4544_03925 [candidate division WS5 bacterium]|uniref:Uncharacterized protein n=1 Tax=candidate division WS5 bacterium TaxID=2093353 RepID=A0A419DD41_9BACT|nr:MAG: hypothetical protein C4544_03925 [candidate division WS5 bacterium]